MYRLIENPKVTEEVVLHAHRKATIQKMKESGESILLSIQDTTMLNYTPHQKTEGLGDFGAGPDHKGLIVHSALAVTPTGVALGLLDQFIWTRDPEERGKRTAKRQKPMEEKESYKWLKSMDNSRIGIPKGIRLVHVGDREADVYEFFDHAIANEQDFLVRVVQNRVTTEAVPKGRGMEGFVLYRQSNFHGSPNCSHDPRGRLVSCQTRRIPGTKRRRRTWR